MAYETGPIQTARLVLRPWSEADNHLFSWLATNPKVMRFIGDGSLWDAARVDEIFQRQSEHWDKYGFGWRSLSEKATSRRIGFVGLNHVSPEATDVADDEIEIGWWLDPDFWRQGLATEGATALRDEGFERIGLERIIGRYQPENIASGRIMDALGMSFERDALGSHGGPVRIYALDRTDWLRLQRH
ncbi:MAG: GNAT family N-acetyltransferase [Actinomycetota bacterium]